ncbi:MULTISPECIES: protein YpfM [Pectobacteriaceae]|uniref:Protein YpfM n=2 Tax=Dickeya TaxID=204037 RepID=A0ABX8W2W9_9GAMM|nr:protein YpfM [Dickeya parazeae]MBP2844874.1 protein YpfM [Dickeya oryzae]MCA6985929.1 protein YpfM [Dickeya zeae]UJR56508.1 protein YpfM [Dickeya zeae MS1]MBP2849115.1 protein YpfM [Dickeya oryzae]
MIEIELNNWKSFIDAMLRK